MTRLLYRCFRVSVIMSVALFILGGDWMLTYTLSVGLLVTLVVLMVIEKIHRMILFKRISDREEGVSFQSIFGDVEELGEVFTLDFRKGDSENGVDNYVETSLFVDKKDYYDINRLHRKGNRMWVYAVLGLIVSSINLVIDLPLTLQYFVSFFCVIYCSDLIKNTTAIKNYFDSWFVELLFDDEITFKVGSEEVDGRQAVLNGASFQQRIGNVVYLRR